MATDMASYTDDELDDEIDYSEPTRLPKPRTSVPPLGDDESGDGGDRSAILDRVRSRFAAPAAPGSLVDAVKATRLPKPRTSVPPPDDRPMDEFVRDFMPDGQTAEDRYAGSGIDELLDLNRVPSAQGVPPALARYDVVPPMRMQRGDNRAQDDKKPPALVVGATGLAARMGDAGLDTTKQKLATTPAPARPSLADKLDAKITQGADQGGAIPVDDDPRSMVAALKKGDDVFDYSFITRAGEDAGAAWMNREPDYAASNRVARLAAEGKQRPIALAKAAQEDADRAMRQKEMEANVKLRLAQADAAARGPQTKPMSEYERARMDETARHNLVMEGRPVASGTAQRPPSDYQISKDRTKLMNDLAVKEEKLRGIASLLEEFDNTAPTDPKDSPDSVTMYGARQGGLTAAAINSLGGLAGFSDEKEQDLARSLAQRELRLQTLIGQKDSGLTLTLPEQQRLQSFLGMRLADKPEVMREAIELVRKGLRNSVAALYAPVTGSGPLDVGAEYIERSRGAALHPDNPVFKERERAQSAPPLPTAKPVSAPPTNAEVQSMVDGPAPERRKRKLRDGSEVTVEKQPDGTWKEVT